MSNEIMNETLTRRRAMLSGAAAFAGGAVLMNAATKGADAPGTTKPREKSAADAGTAHVEQTPLPPGEAGRDYNPVYTPNGQTMPWKLVDGVKVFHIVT